MDLLGQFKSNDFSLAQRCEEEDRIKELEAELSQMTNRILVLQNENNELRSVEVANNSVDYKAAEE